jgi:hypothetical integral membrane protein (TIGR02206 family)
MQLFGVLHLSLLAGTAATAATLAVLCRRDAISSRLLRLLLGWGLVVNELIWWWFRYSQEGFRFPHNMPLQLCDIGVWMTAIACLTLKRPVVEFAWFGGVAGAAMALLTPDLWSPWPSYPAVYFFLAHGTVVVGAAVLVLGRIVQLHRGAMMRAFGILVLYAAFVGAFNAVFGTNYMYLCRKPENASLLDHLGPWPVYLASSAVVAIALFWLLALPVTTRAVEQGRRQ